jgi:pimeloyl-ACP methyl ester carboxylesterase
MLERHLACLAPSGFHRVAYDERPGPAGAPTLVCVHGLSRNSHDFDVLADAMSRRYRVVCPDMAGRGRSEWLKNSAEYVVPTYVADCAALIARLDVETVDWVGTSMGAVIGFLLAAQPGAPIRKLVVNDAGPFVSKETLAWLGTFIGADPTFESLEAMERAVRENSAGFGALTDAQWRAMTLYLSRPKPGGGYGFAYDPRIGDPYKQKNLPDVDLWPFWDRVVCPTLVLRGAESNVLARDVAEAMTERGPKPKLVEFAGIGHAPALMSEDQIGAVRDFLLG